jgi:hypothetical protein
MFTMVRGVVSGDSQHTYALQVHLAQVGRILLNVSVFLADNVASKYL